MFVTGAFITNLELVGFLRKIGILVHYFGK